MKPVVTIFVATYNQEGYISDCLEGIIMQQTKFPIQAIVYDDHSSDATPSIVSAYAERYPDIIKPRLLKENCRRRRIRKFTKFFLPEVDSKYIAICEGDDYWTDPLKLQKQVDFLEAHPGYSACVHNFSPKFEDVPEYIFHGHINKERDLDADDMVLELVTQTATLVCRTEALKGNHEFVNSVLSGRMMDIDRYLYITLLCGGKIRGLTEVMSVYRIQSHGISTRAYLKGIAEKKEEMLIRSLAETYDGKFSFLNALYDMRRHLDEWTFKRRAKEYRKAIMALWRALKCSPKGFLKLYCKRYV